MSQSLLFPPTPDPLGIVAAEDGSLRWTCPHCGGSVCGEPGETRDTAIADPACCLCRAEFAGLAFVEWRRLPQQHKDASRPLAEWRSRVERGRLERTA